MTRCSPAPSTATVARLARAALRSSPTWSSSRRRRARSSSARRWSRSSASSSSDVRGGRLLGAAHWRRRTCRASSPRSTSCARRTGRCPSSTASTAADGREIWVRDVGVVDRGDDGELYVHGYLTDVTREKELERELAAERAQAEAFFRDSPVGMGITDGDGRYLRVNEALARINGVSVERAPRPHARGARARDSPRRSAPLSRARARSRASRSSSRRSTSTRGRARVVPRLLLPDRGRRRRALRAHRHRHHEAAARRGAVPAPDRATAARHLREHARARAEVRRIVSPQIEELYGYPARGLARAIRSSGTASFTPTILRDGGGVSSGRRASAASRSSSSTASFAPTARIRWVLDLMNTVRDADGQAALRAGLPRRRHRAQGEREPVPRRVRRRVRGDGHLERRRAVRRRQPRGLRACSAARATSSLGRQLEAVSVAAPASGVVERLARDRAPRRHRARDSSSRRGRTSCRAVHISVLRDVTERRQLERDLWRAQRLESVGRLAGGVAHDFNNLLTAIRGYAQLLLAQVAPGSVEHHHAEEIDRAADRAAALTAQLLAFGRRQVLQARPDRAQPPGREPRGRCCTRLVGDDIELAFELEPGVLPVRVDPAQIEQVLVNLVANAADVTPAGGRVVVRTANADAVRSTIWRTGATPFSRSRTPAPASTSRRSSICSSRSSRRRTSARASASVSRRRTASRKQSGGTIVVATAAGRRLDLRRLSPRGVSRAVG